jgi:hypothetical protein
VPWYSKGCAAFIRHAKIAMVLRASRLPTGAILAVAWLVITGCTPERTPATGSDTPEIRLDGVRFQVFRGDAIRADGTAAEVTFRREAGLVLATDLAATLPASPSSILLTATRGEGLVGRRTFEVSGTVRAVRGDDVATTEVARFEPDAGPRGLIRGDRPVELHGRGYRMRGDGFVFDPATEQIAIRGGARLVAGGGGLK